MKKVYQNWLLVVLCGILSSVVGIVIPVVAGAYSVTAVAGYAVYSRVVSVVNAFTLLPALIIVLGLRKNAGKVGAIVLPAIYVLYSLFCFFGGRMMAALYAESAEVIELTERLTRPFSVSLLLLTAAAVGVHLLIKNRPWYVLLIINTVLTVFLLAVDILSLRLRGLTIIGAIDGVRASFFVLLPALRVVNTEIPIEERPVKVNTDGTALSPTKSRMVAALLAFFVGTTGAHRYYLGYKKEGIVQTCGCVGFILGYGMIVPAIMAELPELLVFAGAFLLFAAGTGIWAFVDFIRVLTYGLKPADGSSYAEIAPAQVQAPVDTNVDAIEKLAKLHEQGILTDDEFNQKKADILSKM